MQSTITELREFETSPALRLDKINHVIRGVKLVGLRSKNGRSYLPDALRRAAPLYESVRVNVDHIDRGERSYASRIGSVRSVVFRAGAGLFGDLHYNPRHSLAPMLEWDAEFAPQHVGLSHDVIGKTAWRGGQTVVEEIKSVKAVDLVADPATTDGLFESDHGERRAAVLAEAAAAGLDPKNTRQCSPIFIAQLCEQIDSAKRAALIAERLAVFKDKALRSRLRSPVDLLERYSRSAVRSPAQVREAFTR